MNNCIKLKVDGDLVEIVDANLEHIEVEIDCLLEEDDLLRKTL